MGLTGQTPSTKLSLDHEMMMKNDITRKDVMMIYMSPHPFRDSFEEEFRLRLFDHIKHPTAGLVCFSRNGRLYLQDIQPSTYPQRKYELGVLELEVLGLYKGQRHGSNNSGRVDSDFSTTPRYQGFDMHSFTRPQ
jgi:hypothetical protein